MGEFEAAAEMGGKGDADAPTRNTGRTRILPPRWVIWAGWRRRAPAVEALRRRKTRISPCAFARDHLFYIKDEGQLEAYIEGLRRAGVPE